MIHLFDNGKQNWKLIPSAWGRSVINLESSYVFEGQTQSAAPLSSVKDMGHCHCGNCTQNYLCGSVLYQVPSKHAWYKRKREKGNKRKNSIPTLTKQSWKCSRSKEAPIRASFFTAATTTAFTVERAFGHLDE